MVNLEKQENKKEYLKKYYLKNKEKKKEYDKKYREDNKQKIKSYRKTNEEKNKEYNKLYRLKNIEKIRNREKEHYKNNKEKNSEQCNKYQKSRKKTDPLFKLRCNIRNLILLSIKKQGYTKNSKSCQILGCTFEEFKLHLERQFTVGMTWHNQGKWHLDHIYPVSLAKDEEELIKLNHYTNFQPMWAIENIIKGNKIITNTQIKLI